MTMFLDLLDFEGELTITSKASVSSSMCGSGTARMTSAV